MKDNKKIVILGAGPTGLAAGWKFAENGYNDLVILEKNKMVGGMVRSEQINGNMFECGAHYFHVDDKELLDKVLKLLNGNYVENKRNLQIKFKGTYFQYPLKINDLIKGFSLSELIAFFLSMVYALGKNKLNNKELITAEDALIAAYGRKLYREFFEDYITSFWGMHPSRLSAVFALRRIPKMDALIMFKKVLAALRLIKQKNEEDRFIETVEGNLYYPRLGMGQIWNGIAELISKANALVYTDCRIKQIINKNDRIESIVMEHNGGFQDFEVRSIVSTIPLYDLLNSFESPDRQILDIASSLKYRSLVIFGMLINKERLLPSYCAYFRERKFSRLSEPKLAGLRVNPDNKTILLAEVSCDFNDETWDNPEMAKRTVLEDLEKEGIVERSAIEEIFILKEKYAYPIFDVGYEEKIERIRDYIGVFKNLYSTGRQGLFQYINSHMALKAGFSTSEYILKHNQKQNSGDSNLFY